MLQKNKLSLSVQYPDKRLQDIVTRPKLRSWVKAALLAPAQITSVSYTHLTLPTICSV